MLQKQKYGGKNSNNETEDGMIYADLSKEIPKVKNVLDKINSALEKSERVIKESKMSTGGCSCYS